MAGARGVPCGVRSRQLGSLSQSQQSGGSLLLKTAALGGGVAGSSPFPRMRLAWSTAGGSSRATARDRDREAAESALSAADALRPDYTASRLMHRPGSGSRSSTAKAPPKQSVAPSVRAAQATGSEDRLQKLLSSDSQLLRQPPLPCPPSLPLPRSSTSSSSPTRTASR